jgi:hypothetical protein
LNCRWSHPCPTMFCAFLLLVSANTIPSAVWITAWLGSSSSWATFRSAVILSRKLNWLLPPFCPGEVSTIVSPISDSKNAALHHRTKCFVTAHMLV